MTSTNPEDEKSKRRKIAELTSLVVTGTWLTALLTGQGWWLVALLLGYIVVVPAVSILLGVEEEGEDEERSRKESGEVSRPKADAMEVLRERYAHGELTEEQFERKLELLLDTETLENAEEWVLDTSGARQPREDEELEEEHVQNQKQVSRGSSK